MNGNDSLRLLRKSGLPISLDAASSLSQSSSDLGQSYPQHYPQSPERPAASLDDPLGEPLTIGEAAAIIGCSAWTVRQKYLPAGLPHHRLSRTGRLIFYRNQIIRWLLKRQQKGGSTL